jgi:hypothetical protein
LFIRKLSGGSLPFQAMKLNREENLTTYRLVTW